VKTSPVRTKLYLQVMTNLKCKAWNTKLP